MNPLETHPEAGSEPALPAQSQSRLLHLAGQLDLMQAHLDRLADDVHDNGGRLDALVGALLVPQGGPAGGEHLAELLAQIDGLRAQVEQMHGALAAVATQGQIDDLLRTLAGQEMLTDVADSVKKLGRTQFKANALGESREQQIETALALARELVARREQAQERRTADERARLDELRRTARGELAADLLPALDSIELALTAGRAMLERQRQQLAAARVRYADAAAQRPEAPSSGDQAAGLWGRLRRNLAGEAHPTQPSPATRPAPPAELDLADELAGGVQAWLSGLELARDRFLDLLALEEIQPLPALGQAFDPRLHLAIAAETRADVPANTVVRVLRQGYRQRQRVLRYAEVVVARPPADEQGPATSHEGEQRP